MKQGTTTAITANSNISTTKFQIVQNHRRQLTCAAICQLHRVSQIRKARAAVAAADAVIAYLPDQS